MMDKKISILNSSQIWVFFVAVLFFISCGGGSFKSGQKDGWWTDKYNNGHTSSEGKYDKGIKVGEWKKYFPDGVLEFQINYNDEGIKHGDWKSFHKNGKLKKEGIYKNGGEEGKWVEYHENGETAIEKNYKNDKKIGSWTWYHPNGKVSQKGQYGGYKRIGKWTFFDPAGKLMKEEFYENGKLLMESKDH